MASNDREKNNRTGSIGKGKSRVVTLRTKRDKNIDKELEFKELLEIIESGKVDPSRTMEYLEEEYQKPGWKQKMSMQTARLTLRISPNIHERLKQISQARDISINDLVNDVLDRFCKRQLKRLRDDLGGSKSVSHNQEAHGGAPGGRERGSEPGIPPFSISKLPG